MPKGYRLKVEVLEEIKVKYDLARKEGLGRVQAYEAVGADMEIDWKTIAAVIRRLKPTTQLAQDYLKASAMRLAVRVVRNAGVQQSIDLLSRPNIGVLAPIQQAQGGGGGGFFLSVTADSCGSVKVGVMPAPTEIPTQLTEGEVIDGEQERPNQRATFGRGTAIFRSTRAQQLATETRERLARQRKTLSVGGFGDEGDGLQPAHESTEEEE